MAFAHLLLACFRSLGLAARYVSSYLSTVPPPGRSRLVGADATHAWVSLFCGDAGWVDFDPTNDQIPHDRHVLRDYRLCKSLGLGTLRDGVRWHLVEKTPGQYDWSSWMPALEAAEEVGVQVIWDLFHYGSPDHIDQASPDFPKRFTDFALAALDQQRSWTEIQLAGVVPAEQGRGRYGHLLAAVEDACTTRRLVVTAQAHQTGIQRIWSRYGFEPVHNLLTVHLVAAT